MLGLQIFPPDDRYTLVDEVWINFGLGSILDLDLDEVWTMVGLRLLIYEGTPFLVSTKLFINYMALLKNSPYVV